ITTDIRNMSAYFQSIYELGMAVNNGKTGSITSLIQLTRNDTLSSLIAQLDDVIQKLEPKIGEGPIADTFRGIHKVGNAAPSSRLFQMSHSFEQGLEALQRLADRRLFEIHCEHKSIKLLASIQAY